MPNITNSKQLDNALKKLAVMESRLLKVRNLRDRAIAAVQTKYQSDIEERTQKLDEHLDAIAQYLRDQRDRKASDKTIVCPHGNIKWRYAPAKLEILDETVVIDAIRQNGNDQLVACIVTAEKINKTALKQVVKNLAYDFLEGIQYLPGDEYLHIQPLGTDTVWKRPA